MAVSRKMDAVQGSRECFDDGSTKVYAYVHNQITSAADQLDEFLVSSGAGPDERVTTLTDGAGEFDKAARRCRQPVCLILDWFHVPMKFKTADRSAFGCKQIPAEQRADCERDIIGAKWIEWHRKANQAIARLRGLDKALMRWSGYEFGTVWWNLHHVMNYVRDNPGLGNYARRYRKGLPVSSSMAESAITKS